MASRRSTHGDTKTSVAISILSKETGLPVNFKHDGARFAQPQTLKITEGETYVLGIAVSGDASPQLVGIEVGYTRLKLEYSGARKHEATAAWTADCVRPTRDGHRDEVLVAVTIRTSDGASRSAIFPLQVKVYAASRHGTVSRAHASGEPLGKLHLQMEWEDAGPYSPIARADARFKFSRRSSSRASTESLPGMPIPASAGISSRPGRQANDVASAA
mmetsp:Transcript_1992/g.5689  ORF Transcript_1992/g.5689 Transcript_1992/m.5689 type:complete len:217 (+) Transcript_1992:104-754(+)